MQRPVMNPGMFEDATTSKKPRARFSLLRPVARAFKFVGRILFYRPLSRRLRVDDGLSPLSRFVRGFLYRLAFVPLLVAVLVGALVFAGTHPARPETEIDPSSQGIFFES